MSTSGTVSGNEKKSNYIFYVIGNILLYSGVYGIFALISSVHIEGGVGTTSMAVCYSSTIIPALFVPFLAERFSVKKMFLAAIICYFLFVFGNIFSSYVSLMFAGVMNGLGESSGWTMASLFNIYFAKHAHLDKSAKKDEDTYVKQYFGYFWSIVQSSVGIGNTFVFVILYIDRNVFNQPVPGSNSTHNITNDNLYKSFCGASDCQDPNITQLNMQQYSPVNKVTYYIIVGTCMLLIAIAFFIHLLFLPENIQAIDTTAVEDVDLALVNDDDKESSIHVQVKESVDENLCTNFNTSVIKTVKMLFCFKHSLIVLLPIYNGFLFSYVYGEMTRAFAACFLGLDDVSISTVLFSLGNVISSYFSGQMAASYSRNLPFALGYVLDMSLYLTCLLLDPADTERWIVYILFFGFGLSMGVWITLVNELYGDYFPANQDIAFNLWNVLFNVGLFVFYAISTIFCVYVKIYILMTALTLAMFLYVVSQCWFGYVSTFCSNT